MIQVRGPETGRCQKPRWRLRVSVIEKAHRVGEGIKGTDAFQLISGMMTKGWIGLREEAISGVSTRFNQISMFQGRMASPAPVNSASPDPARFDSILSMPSPKPSRHLLPQIFLTIHSFQIGRA